MLKIPKFPLSISILLIVLTGVSLILELKIFTTQPNIPWRSTQWLGGVWFYICAVCAYLVTIGIKTTVERFNRREFLLSCALPLLFTASLGLVYVMKVLLGRGGYSENGLFLVREVGLFPSGHTYTAFLTFTLLYNALLNLRINSKKIFFCFFLIALIALLSLLASLFLSGDHYISDILFSGAIYTFLMRVVSKVF